MKIWSVIAIGLTAVALAFGQNNLKKADFYFMNRAYAKAIEFYEPVFHTSPTFDLAIKLAEANYRLRNIPEAYDYFDRAKSYQELNDEQMEMYFDVLRETGKLKEAQALCKDRKLSDKAASLDSVDKWYMEGSGYYVNNLNFNTPNNDFGMVPFINNQRIIFSDRSEKNSSALISGVNNRNYLDMYVMNISDTQLATPNYVKLNITGGKFHDAVAFFDAGENKFYFTRSNANRNQLISNKNKLSTLGIIIADVDDKGRLKNFKEFKYNSREYSVGHPWLSNDRDKLYFVSDMPSGRGGTDIYMCRKGSNGEWEFPINLGPEINSARNEMFPYISPKGELIFSSDGRMGFGGLDLYYAESSGSGLYKRPLNMGAGINTASDDFGLIYDDYLQKSGFLSSDRTGGKGGDDIYRFYWTNKRKCEEKTKSFYVKLVDNKTKQPLSGGVIKMVDQENKDSFTGLTDQEGRVFFSLQSCHTFTLYAKRTNYLSNSFDDVDLSTMINYTAGLDRKELNNIVEIRNIYYEFDRAEIHPTATQQLERLANLLMQNPDIRIELSSHTDSRGRDDYNMKLSQQRAENVVKYLAYMGISPGRMISRGYGESRLINHCGNGVNCLEEEHVQNRRTEFRIIDIMNMSSVASTRDVSQALMVTKADPYASNYSKTSPDPMVSPAAPSGLMKSVEIEASKRVGLKFENESVPALNIQMNPQLENGGGSISSNTYYSIQVGAFSNPKSLDQFAYLTNVHMIVDNGRYLVLSGKFNTLQEANSYKPLVRNSVPSAFAIKVANGAKIPMK